MKLQSRLAITTTSFFACLTSGPVLADMQTNLSQQPYRLNTVVVTAESGNAPVVGSSVTVLSGETLAQRGIDSPRELTAITPNLTVFDANGDRTPRFSLRGLRENNFSYGQSAVAIYVDDVPCSDLYTRGVPLFDLYSGEFYRGPQPTLYGANRPGGVLNLLTHLPGNDWRARGSAGYGNYDALDFEAGFSGPIVKDKLFFGASGIFNSRDGYFDNLVTGDDADEHETLAGRLQLRWTLAEHIDMTLSVAADRFRDGGIITRPITATGDFHDVKYDQDGFDDQDSQTYALRAAWTGDAVEAVSITSWRNWRQDTAGDFDYAEFFSPNNFPLNGLTGFSSPEVQQWSQEIRLQSVDKDADFKWNAGAYWSELTTDYESGYIYGPLAPVVVDPSAPSSGTDSTSGRYRTDDYAVFGQMTHTLAEKLDLTAGLRFEYVDVSGNRNHTFDGFPIAAPMTFHDDFSSLQPRVGLAFHINENVVTWFNFTTGFQPGGFSSSSDNSSGSHYDSAESLHYEIGISAKLFENKLIATATGFWIDTRDYQVYRPVADFTGLDFYVVNADKARTIGGELELRALPCEYFEFRVAGGYQHAEFRDFTTPAPFSQNLDGKDINFVPEFTLDASATLRLKRGFYATVGVTAIGDYWFDEANTVKQDAYALLYARAGWKWKNVNVSIFGQNLTDKDYYANALDLGPRTGAPNGFFVGTPGDPLTVGGTIAVEF